LSRLTEKQERESIKNPEKVANAQINLLKKNLTKKEFYKPLIMLTILWTSNSFNFYILAFFLEFAHGGIYLNAVSLAISEIMARLLSGVIF